MNTSMTLSDFNYHLPPELIAHQPLMQRTDSRLLMVDSTGALSDRAFSHLPELINPEDLLVFNNTRVIPARLHGRKETGGKVEVLVERITATHELLAHVKASKAPKAGARLLLEEHITAEVLGRQDDLFQLRFLHDESALELLEAHGHIPLPPYIERPDADADRERYQTVYARHPGAVAAPTAGLHFDDRLLQQLSDRGVRFTEVTLHVGAGTFQPVRNNDLSKHIMHAEFAVVSEQTCAAVAACRERGGRVIAVGTTSVRSLESAAASGTLQPFENDTRLFITPGYTFNVVDAMITNFHLPESTLLMLVSAFSGYKPIFNAYQHAVDSRYRFFSYGDAMLLERSRSNR